EDWLSYLLCRFAQLYKGEVALLTARIGDVHRIIAHIAVQVGIASGIAERVFANPAAEGVVVGAGADEVEADLRVAEITLLTHKVEIVGAGSLVLRLQAEGAIAVAVGGRLGVVDQGVGRAEAVVFVISALAAGEGADQVAVLLLG